jgi:electron transport complex protein RnfD
LVVAVIEMRRDAHRSESTIVTTDETNMEAGQATQPAIQVAPGPHLAKTTLNTRRLMIDVLIGLAPVVAWSLWLFRWGAVRQLAIAVVSCLAAEALFTAMRRRKAPLGDFSAVVTGAILALSLPNGSPWYVGFIAAFVAIGLGKVVFGGVGANMFNPAMVGRAFVMIAFPAALGASAYVMPAGLADGVTSATPLTAIKQLQEVTALGPLFIGLTNGALGETSALACLIGGAYLLIRRTASWEIPLGVILAVVVLAGVANLLHRDAPWTVLHHVFAGSLMFGAFFIATDPVSSPLTPRGKFIFGLGTGLFVMVIRGLSGYPEGVMFAVLLMNALVPLINRWTVPVPVGGLPPVPPEQKK